MPATGRWVLVVAVGILVAPLAAAEITQYAFLFAFGSSCG